jgi:hypothetical protein
VEVSVDTKYDAELCGNFEDVDINDLVDVVLFNLCVMCGVRFSVLCFLGESFSVVCGSTSVKHLDVL